MSKPRDERPAEEMLPEYDFSKGERGKYAKRVLLPDDAYFETSSPKYGWLDQIVTIGVGQLDLANSWVGYQVYSVE